MEAGVDLDFQAVYRQLGRSGFYDPGCRKVQQRGNTDKEDSRVFLFQFDEKRICAGQRLQIDVSKLLVSEGTDIASLQGIKKYFEALYHLRGESLDKKKILEEFKNKRYNFAKAASEFNLIEENTKTVFIPREPEAAKLLDQIRYHGYTKSGMRKAGQYCVQLYENEFEKFRGAGMVRLISENITDFYELVNEMCTVMNGAWISESILEWRL